MEIPENILKQIITDEELDADSSDDSTYVPLKEHKYVMVSRMAYLSGVPDKHFAESGKIFKKDIYNQLNFNKNARIIRNLCRLRTSIEQKFGYIISEVTNNGREVLSLREYIPQDAIILLENDGVRLSRKGKTQPVEYVIEINKLISDRINNCKNIFPTWIKWEYIKDIFIMPDGFTKKGTAIAAEEYYKHKNGYPFHVYLNIHAKDDGNIFYNDRRFVQLIYEWNNDVFTDISKVMDASAYVKSNIYEFIDKSEKIVMIVDCENSDIYNFISMLKSLTWDDGLYKISKLILINDIHTSLGWQNLSEYTNIPIEHIMTERIKQEKSLVDGTVIAKTYEEFYENNVDSFILLSSDSDYWSLIKMLKKARFIVAVEHDKCGVDLKNILEENSIFYCYLDDFYSGEESDRMKNDMLLKIVSNELKAHDFNVLDIFESALTDLRINMSEAEKNQFISKYLRNIKMNMLDDGVLQLRLKK